VLTSIRQQPEPHFVAAFIHAFVTTDWSAAGIVVDGWPIS
jgi:hypothetical protein